MNEWGLWDILSIAVSIVLFFAVIWYVSPRKKLKDVYINAIADVGPNDFYKRVVKIEIRNQSNSAIYVESQGFRFTAKVPPHSKAAKSVGKLRLRCMTISNKPSKLFFLEVKV